MIRGEEGTGKEQIARFLYLHSPLVNRPFVVINCELMTDKSWDFLLEHYNSPLNATGNTIYFQNFELIDNLTGRENIMLPMSLHNVSDGESRKRLSRLASYLEITDVLDKFPSQMSGGQKQRVAAARALIMDPGIILADEPTGALDSKNAKTLMKKLAGLNEDENTTILMVTHDSNAASYCKRILFIRDGRIFHELRRDTPDETQQDFYERILKVMSQLGGGSANVL